MQTSFEAFYLLTPPRFLLLARSTRCSGKRSASQTQGTALLGTAPAYGEIMVISTSVDQISFHQFLIFVSIDFSFVQIQRI